MHRLVWNLAVPASPSVPPLLPPAAYVRQQRVPMIAEMIRKTKMAAVGMELLMRSHR